MSNAVGRRDDGQATAGGRRTDAPTSQWLSWRRAGLRALGLALALVPTQLVAQVGHDPAASPFRDINTHQSLTFLGGNFGGNQALATVGAQSGTLMGLRLRTGLAGPLDLMLTTSYVKSQRYRINTTLPDSTRRTGPVDYNLIIADLSLALSITGNKTWHGLAPYLGAGFGVVAPTKIVADPGGYRAGPGFTFTPTAGTRFRLTRALWLQAEVRDNTIRYEWPLAYFTPSDANGNPISPPVLDLGNRDKQLTHNLTLSAGLSYNFNF